MANTNRFQGLHRGPIDHKSSSVINQVANGAIDMGSVVALTATINSAETLPRVEETIFSSNSVYGIAVGGDADGIYGDGSPSTDDSTRATTGALQGVVVVTQGRCLARVDGGAGLVIGRSLKNSGTLGVLQEALSGDSVIAQALNDVAAGDVDMIAVDVQRTGQLN